MTKFETRQILAAVEDAGLPTDALYEVIDGRDIEVSGMGPYGSVIVSNLIVHLGSFARRKLGRVVCEALFRIKPTIYRRPNMAFVSFERWGKDAPAPDEIAWEVIPDLIADVVYKTDEAWEVLAKIRQYFEVGARAVWLIYPNLEVFHIYDSFTQIRVLTRDDILDGGDIIPGFRLPLTALFEEFVDDEDPTNPRD